MTWLTEPRRAWLYRVLVAASAVAVGYGLLNAEQAGLWLALGAAALLGNGLAARNTSTHPRPVKAPLPPRRIAEPAKKPAKRAAKKPAK